MDLLVTLLGLALLLAVIDAMESKEVGVGGILRVAGFGAEPFLTRPKVGTPKGVDMEIVAILANKFNMSIEYRATRTWGALRNGTWAGTVGEVHRGAADLGVGHIVFSHQRLAAVDASPVLYYLPMHILTRKPIPLSQHFNVIKPFTAHSWLAIGLSLVTTMSVVQLLRQGSPTVTDGGSITLDFLASFLKESSSHFYNSLAMNLLLLVWLFGTSLLLMAYECNLRAYLMSIDFEEPIDKPEDLVEQNRALFTMREAANLNFMKESTSPALQKLYNDILRNEQYFPSGRGVPPEMEKEMIESGAAIIISKPISEARQGVAIQRYGSYPFRMAKQPFHINKSGFVIRRNSSLKALFDPALHHMIDNGIVSKLIEDFLFLRKSREPEKVERNEEKLSFDHLFFANLCFAIGIALTLLTFAIERSRMWAST